MALIDPSKLAIGDTVRFKTKAPHDNVMWYGIVNGTVSYDIARQIEDVDTYYDEVKKEFPELDAKETLSYLVLKTTENDVTVTRAVALPLIDQSTLTKVAENTYTTIRIYDLDSSKVNDVIEAIKSMGYTAAVITE